MNHQQRFVFSAPGTWPVEHAIEWASRHGFRQVDFNADNPQNYPETFDSGRRQNVRHLAEASGISLGIHTLSAVNMAEMTPVMSRAVDAYLRENFELASDLGADYVICHGGFHFTSDREQRAQQAIERMQRAAGWAEELGLDIFFENHNREPDHAEIHYMPKDVVETRAFFDAVQSPRFKWAFNVAHAHLVPDGFDGFLDAFGIARIGQVRLNDTHGRYEEHLIPGQGIVDFRYVFRRLNELGYTGPFTLDFGSPDDRLTWRHRFVEWLTEESSNV